MKKSIIISLAAIILIANFTPLTYIFTEDYSYSNYNGKFTFVEEGGGYDYKVAKRRYSRYLSDNPGEAAHDKQLYRTFTLKPWRFWEWREMVFNHERFALPYKSPKGVHNR
ncbi:hypothetical protein D0C36_15980 [Mucilaginibacter conchicola]|uniref:Uncharacterized protein n=1 Tax=Mucilaginibacter conchicola TaxID=2303333 RepID=A0A372NVX3_9SPHI|nr:hypothetical protein [Mucilaginibacter conchicola]RFZ92889.1 hypothetical protein D0C36_15980 [Mucilaginibacter conchicola]